MAIECYSVPGGTIYYRDTETLQLHREYGPAVIEDDGGKSYYNQGTLHRLDGPACIWPGYNEVNYWYVDGEFICQSENPKEKNRLSLGDYIKYIKAIKEYKEKDDE